jgi:hypothetical protein
LLKHYYNENLFNALYFLLVYFKVLREEESFQTLDYLFKPLQKNSKATSQGKSNKENFLCYVA